MDKIENSNDLSVPLYAERSLFRCVNRYLVNFSFQTNSATLSAS